VFGLATVVVVSLLVMLGARLMGKGARFHYLERQHLAHVMGLAHSLEQVADGSPRAASVTREGLQQDIAKAREIASQVDVELLKIEQLAFGWIGYGGVIDLPHKDVDDLNRMAKLIEAEPGSGVTPALAAKLDPDMRTVLNNSDRFGPLVADAVGFVKAAVLVINLLGIALLVSSLLLIRQATLGPLQQALDAANRIAQGDLSGHLQTQSHDEVGKLLGALEDMKNSLARVVGDVRQRSQAVAARMVDVTTESGDLSARTERQASSLQETAATMEEITATVKQSTQSVHEAHRLAQGASQVAGQGGAAVSQVVSSMGAILSSSKKIADITSMINGIAFQTNILALNAAVESARAGEHGRGFAVVAAEVRTLAQRSAAAAKDIDALIRDSVEKVEAGSRQVTQAGQTIDEVVSSVNRLNGIIAEVATAFAEQETGIAQIDRSITDLDQMTQQNAALVVNSVATAQAVRAESEGLVQTVAQFKLAA
jgi:methyl-accepting chemotaxis protein